MLGGDLTDSTGQVDVLLGHPLDLMLGTRVVTVDGVVADQLQIYVSCAHPNLWLMPGGLPCLADGGEEVDTSAKVADDESGVQTLAELAPIRNGGRGTTTKPSDNARLQCGEYRTRGKLRIACARRPKGRP
jgi:hypothetical protein